MVHAVRRIAEAIYCVRGENVRIDSDLAALYGISTKALNRAIKRNRWRFPPDFVFRLTLDEWEALVGVLGGKVRQHGGRRYRPYVFTELGAGMVGSLLRRPRAVAASVKILRAFAGIRGDVRSERDDDRTSRRILAAIRDVVLLQPEDVSYTTTFPTTYFLQAGESGPIKIGVTKNLVVRVRALGAMSPVPVRLLGVMKGDGEQRCHAALGAFRLHGEWFAPSATVLEFIWKNAITPAAADFSKITTAAVSER